MNHNFIKEIRKSKNQENLDFSLIKQQSYNLN